MSNLTTREETVRKLVKDRHSQLKALVPDKATQSKYASAITSIAMQNQLLNVNPQSIVKTAFEIVQLGLNPNPLFGQAYVVPYSGIAQLQIGYKGYITLLKRAGWTIRAVAVYNIDDFSIKFAGLKDEIKFEPDYDNRQNDDGAWVYKNLKGVIVYAKHKDGEEYSEFIPFRVLEKLRVNSPNQKAGELSNIWFKWTEDMYLAKAIKKVAKKLPLDDERVIEATILEDRHTQSTTEVNISQQPEQQPEQLNTQLLPPKEETKDDISKYYTDLINAGVKRSDLKNFIECYQITTENASSILSDIGGLSVMVEEFYKSKSSK